MTPWWKLRAVFDDHRAMSVEAILDHLNALR